MTRSLPANPDLERLRREAKALKTACAAGDPVALARLAALFPGAEAPSLAEAQAAIARDYGFPSWPKLKAAAQVAREARARRIARSEARRARTLGAAAQVEALAARLLTLAHAGDPQAIANLPGVGRTIGLKIRDRIAANPDAWRAVVDALIAGLAHANPKVRFECAHALDTYADIRARDALVPLIDDPVPRVRWMAMHALACDACKVAPPPFTEAICARIAERALADDSIQVRRHAAWELGLCGGAGAVPTLDALLARETDRAVLRNASAARRRLAAT